MAGPIQPSNDRYATAYAIAWEIADRASIEETDSRKKAIERGKLVRQVFNAITSDEDDEPAVGRASV